MKFPSQHKQFSVVEKGNRSIICRAHRVGNKVWATSKATGRTIAHNEFTYVAQAKAWMDNPSLTFPE